ncbi:N-acetyltransferase [Emcibacter sp. SYSU 3D8]|uniref:GNAT family N-acetyltransferase n=1 Tax=Emcibacter sp. SYSU 3D8 TaxID=3133969 RepID=UPI0031FE6774
MIVVRNETALDIPAREILLDRALPGRHLKTCEKLRRGRVPAEGLAFSALTGQQLVGTVRLWHVTAGTAGAALLLGPIGVLPEYHGLGIGTLLMDHALAEASARAHGAVILVGDASYYGRFGFTAELTGHLTLPGPVERDRFLGLELTPAALRGASGMVAALGEALDDDRRGSLIAANENQTEETLLTAAL